MRREKMEIGVEIRLPEIEFSSDKTRIKRGESVVLRWSVKEAEEAALWKSVILPFVPEPLDWRRINQLGEKVNLVDGTKLTAEETTACYLVVKTPLGMSGRRIVVEVVGEQKPKPKSEMWEPPKEFLGMMEERPHIAWIEQTTEPVPSVQFLGPGLPPLIKISASPEVVFEDESSLMSWNIANANCATSGCTKSRTTMVASAGDYSGTKMSGGGGGAGGMPSCMLSMSGSWNISGKAHNSCHIEVHISAHNATGKSAAASQWVDVLSIPKFTENPTSARKSFIRSTLKTFDKKLRSGCIYNDTALDTTVAAFKNGHLDRKEFWARLLAELQNIGLITFACKDVKDKGWSAGGWYVFTNTIILRWSPNHSPTPYAIAWLLILKCGFNMGLYKFGYSQSDIMNQANIVAKSCLP